MTTERKVVVVLEVSEAEARAMAVVGIFPDACRAALARKDEPQWLCPSGAVRADQFDDHKEPCCKSCGSYKKRHERVLVIPLGEIP